MPQEQKNITLSSSRKQVGYFFLGLFFIAVFYFNLIDSISEWIRLGLGNLSENQIYSLNQLTILKDIFIAGLIFLVIIISFAKGVKPSLKSYNEKGLIYYLILTPTAGLVAGLMASLILGSFLASTFGLVFGLIFGLTAGLVPGLVLGIIFGLNAEKSNG